MNVHAIRIGTLLGVLLLLVVFPACEDQRTRSFPGPDRSNTSFSTGGGIKTFPLSDRTPADGPLFQSLSPEETGISFENPLDTDHPMTRLYDSGFAGGGVAIGDVNGDNRPDLFLSSGAGRNRLYVQGDEWEFKDVSEEAGIGQEEIWSTGASFADIDNDGDLDLYVCNYNSPNFLYINQGDGTFVESASSYGLDFSGASLMPYFMDVDLDGYLDLYLLTYHLYREEGTPKGLGVHRNDEGELEVRPEFQKYYKLQQKNDRSIELAVQGRPDHVYRNKGGQKFVQMIPPDLLTGAGLSAIWWDYNHDNYPDLYVANDFKDPDRFWRNNGDGSFTSVLKSHLPHTTWFSMGSDFADVNNDGLMDLFVGDMASTTHYKSKALMGKMGADEWFLQNADPPQYMRNALLINTGTDRFMEAAYQAGVAASDWTWTPKFADYDNDGRVDLYVTNGLPRQFTHPDYSYDREDTIGKTQWDVFKDTPPRTEQNLAFHNSSELRFEDVSASWGLDHVGITYGAATGDLDRDGDMDLVSMHLDEPVGIYENRSSTGHRIILELKGTHSNRYGLGATVRLHTDSGQQMRYLNPMTGFTASDEPILHFGLGEEQTISTLEVQWPSGHRQTFTNLPADHRYVIAEPRADPPSQKTIQKPGEEPMYTPETSFPDVEHREQPFDDFERQPLLPWRLSRLGPGIAWGDADGDGDQDVYIGGAAGQSGQLLIRQDDGSFRKRPVPAFSNDADHEDMGAVWIDFDQDGDRDLYVVSGGIDCEPEASILQDRIYVNNGDGEFTRGSEEILPDLRTSGSIVSTADVDRDGDLDLFVGGRTIPGQYPLSPDSHLLRNDGGTFTDVTEQLAPGLKQTGMVTGATWTDTNNDGWLDLMVTQEWGPVKLFRNDQGSLVNRTAQAGLAKRHGWWNGIEPGDLNNDGHMDYLVTNFGRNTKYHASAETPVLLYYGDFNGDGNKTLVEAKAKKNTLLPIRGKSCSSGPNPFVDQKFPTYDAYARANLPEIYTKEKLKQAKRYRVNTLETGVYMNNGRGEFTFHPLPELAQISPSFGVVTADVTGDGHQDIYLVQNFFSPQVETGHMDGGLSVLLEGNGDGTFHDAWPRKSGLSVHRDAMALTRTDFNTDGRVDFLASVNNGTVRAFRHRASGTNRFVTVRLSGAKGNRTGIGARITAVRSDGQRQTVEVTAGSGYLSQSIPSVVFGLGEEATLERIRVRWPDGHQQTYTKDLEQELIILHR